MAAEGADLEDPARPAEPDEQLEEPAGHRPGQHALLPERGVRLGRQLGEQRVVRRGDPLRVLLDPRIDEIHCV